MANVTVPAVNLAAAEAGVAEPAAGSITTADTGIVTPGRETMLRLNNAGASAATVTVAAAPYCEPLTVTVGASATEYVRIADTTYYQQSDGKLHLTASATVSAIALTT